MQYVTDFNYNGKDAELYLSSMAVGEKNNNYTLIVMKDTKVRRGRGWGNPLFNCIQCLLMCGIRAMLRCMNCVQCLTFQLFFFFHSIQPSFDLLAMIVSLAPTMMSM